SCPRLSPRPRSVSARPAGITTRGPFFPREIRKKDVLRFYASQFDATEPGRALPGQLSGRDAARLGAPHPALARGRSRGLLLLRQRPEEPGAARSAPAHRVRRRESRALTVLTGACRQPGPCRRRRGRTQTPPRARPEGCRIAFYTGARGAQH